MIAILRAMATTTAPKPASKPAPKRGAAKKATPTSAADTTPSGTRASTKQAGVKKAATKAAPAGKTTVDEAATAKPRTRGGNDRVVREYLNALVRPKRRGRPVDRASLQARAAAETDPVARIVLLQRALEVGVNEERSIQELQAEFVKVAAAWSTQRGVSWKAWREFGVPPAVLREAGVRETR